MKIVFAAILCLCLASEAFSFDPGRPVGSMKGVRLVNEHIIGKVFDRLDLNARRFSISRIAGESIADLQTVLGGYREGTSTNEFSGATPNPYNLMLWHVVVYKFADVLAQVCSEGRTPGSPLTFAEAGEFQEDIQIRLNRSLEESLVAICEAEASEWSAESLLWMNVWDGIFGFGYDDERSAWLSYLEGMSSSQTQKIKDGIMAAMLNPYFLLAH